MDLKYTKMKFQMPKKLAILVALFFANNAGAAIVLEHSATISLGTDYHSNIQYLEHDAESAYIYSLTPEYKVKALDGTNEWFGNIGVALQRSSNTTVSRNREDPFATIGWKRALEKGMFGLTASYLKESTRTAQFAETGLVVDDGTGVTRAIIADWTRNLTDKVNLTMQAGYEKNKFSGSNAFSDFDVRNINAELDYKLNERVTPFIRVAATDYRSIDRTKYQDLLGGASVTLTQQLKVKVGAGVTHISTVGEDEAVWLVEAVYANQKSVVELELTREVFPTATNLIELGDQLGLTYGYLLSDKSQLGFDLRLSQNDTGLETQDILGFYQHNFTASLLMRLSAAVGNIKSENQNSANNNTIGVTFTYNSPKF